MHMRLSGIYLQWHAVDFVALPRPRQETDEEKMEIDSENYDAAHTPSIKSKMCKYYISSNPG